MNNNKSYNIFVPVIIGIIVICIVFYLIANVKQDVVKCSKSDTDSLGITINEEITTTLGSREIDSLLIVKTIILPEKYRNKANFEAIEFSLRKAFDYLGNSYKINVYDDRVVLTINLKKEKPVILDNISFVDNSGGLSIIVKTNTKDSEIITLSVNDEYSEGELMTKLKNRGYSCN